LTIKKKTKQSTLKKKKRRYLYNNKSTSRLYLVVKVQTNTAATGDKERRKHQLVVSKNKKGTRQTNKQTNKNSDESD
jgi:hypothetical protein